MKPRLYDAHNHYQDERLKPYHQNLPSTLAQEGLAKMVVNGSSEEDWADVLGISKLLPECIPSFGLHPWYVRERSPRWLESLKEHLDAVSSAVGEVGLDRWVKGHDLTAQEEVFRAQLRLAAEREVPASIHCLQAWGRLVEVLNSEPRPACGFILHSFGGPEEMIEPLANLGAYFSLPGYFAHARKARQRAAFRRVPPDRVLVETDAPDQLLPDERVRYPLRDAASGKPINHPGNIAAVYEFAAELLDTTLDSVVAQVEENFRRVFRRWFVDG